MYTTWAGFGEGVAHDFELLIVDSLTNPFNNLNFPSPQELADLLSSLWTVHEFTNLNNVNNFYGDEKTQRKFPH